MVVATAVHIHRGDDFGIVSHPLKCAILFASLFLIGPGKLSAATAFRKRGEGAKNG
jgi:hypothetical protein